MDPIQKYIDEFFLLLNCLDKKAIKLKCDKLLATPIDLQNSFCLWLLQTVQN